MKIKSNKVFLLLGARSPASLNLARVLARNGIKVHIADSLRFPVARWTNASIKYHHLPAPVTHLSAFKKMIKDVIKQYGITDIVPTCEEAFHLSRIKAELDAFVWSGDMDTMERLHRKDQFIELCKPFFKTPKTFNLSAFPNSLALKDFVVKKIYSRFADQVYILKEKEVIMEQINDPANWIAQEFIDGQEYCVYSVWKSGEMLTCEAYLPHLRAGKGAATYFKPVLAIDLIAKIKAFGESLNYTGQLSFDVIKRDEVYYPIECNPRATSGLHMVDKGLYDVFFNRTSSDIVYPKDQSLKLATLLYHPLQVFNPSFWKAADVVFSITDPLPSILQVGSVLELAYIATKHDISLLAATTLDIEWNGASPLTNRA